MVHVMDTLHIRKMIQLNMPNNFNVGNLKNSHTISLIQMNLKDLLVLWTDYKQVENYKTRQTLLIHQLVLIYWRVVPHTISFYNLEPY
jgi:hypothetical protein